MTTHLISLRGVTKGYVESGERRVVLADVDADVESGEFVVVVGRSGSGKSTLLNLLSGIDVPDAGSVRVGGLDLVALGERDRTLFRRHHVGIVFQFFNLVPTLTVGENVRLPLELARSGPPGPSLEAHPGASGRVDADAADRARWLLEQVGLADRADSFPDRLSGGEQQRVALARALCAEPTLVLADEPTGNLDVDTGEVVLDLLDRLVRRAGKTLVMATHSRELAARGDRALRIDAHGLTEERIGP